MKRRKIVIIAILLFTIIVAKNIPKECPSQEEIPSCETLRTLNGFTYLVPLETRQIGACEQGWYFSNGTFIVDPSRPDKKLGCVVAVTQENLTIRTCENLQWQLDCHSSMLHCKVDFTVSDQSKSATDERSTSGGVRNILIGIVGILVLVVVIIIWKCCTRPGQRLNCTRRNDVV